MNKIKENLVFRKDYSGSISKRSNEILSKHSNSVWSLLSTTRTRPPQQVQKLEQTRISPLETDKIDDKDEKLLLTKRTFSGNSKNTKLSGNVTNEEFDKKFKIHIDKSLKLLQKIGLFFSKGVNEPDDDDDYKRRLKRAQEFSTRFSRYYLYPLSQMLNQLSLPMKLVPTTINQKLLNCHQMIVQSLQAYLNHLPTSIGNCACDKFKLLLNQIVYLCQIYGVLKKQKDDEDIDALRSSVEMVAIEIDNFQVKIKEMKKTKIIQKKVAKNPKTIIKQDSNRFSMYESSRSGKSAQSLATKKFKNVKSRYRTATFKHRPHVEPFQRHTSSSSKNTPILNEEDIKSVQNNNGKTQTLNHEDVITDNNLKLVQNGNNVDNIVGIKNALETLQNYFGENYGEFLNKFEGKPCKQNEFVENFHDNKQIDLNKSKNIRKEPVVTVTGVRNAKLICIRDDNSVIDDDDDNKAVEMISSQTQTDINQKEQTNEPRVMDQLVKSPKYLKSLPKDYRTNIIQYKVDFNKYCGKNRLYKKTAEPWWFLIEKIADDVFDELLQAVIKEMEMNEILENLYKSEFQL